MLRSVGAVIAGYAVMAPMTIALTIAWVQLRVPGGLAAMRERMKSGDEMPAPSRAYLAWNLATGLLAAVAGGWLTGRLAPSAPTTHLAWLGGLVLLPGALNTRSRSARLQSTWYQWAIPLVGAAGVALSALPVRTGS